MNLPPQSVLQNQVMQNLASSATSSATSASLIIRSAQPTDVPTIFSLIQLLADYEKLAHQVTGTQALLQHHLFGDRPCAEAVLAEIDGKAAGFALFFTNFSTFLTQPGLYLEDLFVKPEYRGQGIGKALLCYVGQIARERDYGRVEWSVLDWNELAIGFYERMGATILPDWRICRVTGKGIEQLANGGR